MDTRNTPQSTAKIAGHPIHPMIIPFPIVTFVGAFVTDLVYWWQGDPIWATVSLWLLGVGLITGAAAAVAGFTDFFSERGIRAIRAAWIHMVGNVSILGVQVVNFLIRYGDPDAGVIPWGLTLSFLAFLAIHVTGWMGWSMVYRHGVAVGPGPSRP